MPTGPLPSEVIEFVRPARPAVVATLRKDGSPVTTGTWYEPDGDRFLINMVEGGPRVRNLRRDPRLSLTIFGDDWYDHVSLSGEVVDFRDDADLVDLDRLARRYWGTDYPNRQLECVSAIFEVRRWHAWGQPAAAADGAG